MKIINAEKKHADLIADTIMSAIGMDHCDEIAGQDSTGDNLKALFREMAERDDTQYSYRNTLVAIDDNGKPMGAIVSYDGGQLARLRSPFIARLQEETELDPNNILDETEPGEYYLDSLAVLPEYRGREVGRKLIAAAIEQGRSLDLTPGLLVAKDNPSARALYEHLGFRKIGDRPFMGIVMDHMQLTCAKKHE